MRWFLVEKGANPTVGAAISSIEVEGGGRRLVQTPYEVAVSRETRNVFRALATELPELWNWMGGELDGARVPSALNLVKEEERERKLKEQKEKLREKSLKREVELEERKRLAQAEEEKLLEAKLAREQLELLKRGGANLSKTGPQRLGGGPSNKILKAQQITSGAAGLSEQDQMRVDRERRARAAEARFAKPA